MPYGDSGLIFDKGPSTNDVHKEGGCRVAVIAYAIPAWGGGGCVSTILLS